MLYQIQDQRSMNFERGLALLHLIFGMPKKKKAIHLQSSLKGIKLWTGEEENYCIPFPPKQPTAFVQFIPTSSQMNLVTFVNILSTRQPEYNRC